MAADGDDSGSFDPRSWLKSPGSDADVAATRSPGSAAPAAAGASFDPSTWARPADPTPTPPEAPRAAATKAPAAPRSAEQVALARRRLAGGGAALAILAASMSGAYITRQEAAAPPPPAAVAAAAPAPTLAAAPGSSRRTIALAGPEELPGALADLGIAPAEAASLAARASARLGTQPGEIRLIVDVEAKGEAISRVTGLEATRADGSGVRFVAAADGSFREEPLAAKLETRVMSASGEMDNDSFYTSAVAAGVNDSLISDFAKAFSFDINFATDVKPGDTFEAAFEQDYNPAGEAVGSPRLLFVSLRTKEKSLRYYRFTPPGESEAAWFSASGMGNKRALMRTPVDGARISSNFGPRFHPTLRYTRLHGGTDFAAPVGTPIYAAAAGVVTSATPTKCGGNMVVLQHDNGWSTRYFHSSRYAEGTVAGARVTQGQTISYVGNTGTCTTGPHLHYEVWVNGERVDPLSIDTSTAVALEGAALAAFMQQRARVDQARAGPTP